MDGKQAAEVDPAFLAARPKRALEWEEDADGRAVLLRPRFGAARAGRWLQNWLRLSPYKIRLDEVGTLVWKSIDGQTPLAEVAERLRREFGAKVEPAEKRLEQFVRQMTRGRLIEF